MPIIDYDFGWIFCPNCHKLQQQSWICKKTKDKSPFKEIEIKNTFEFHCCQCNERLRIKIKEKEKC